MKLHIIINIYNVTHSCIYKVKLGVVGQIALCFIHVHVLYILYMTITVNQLSMYTTYKHALLSLIIVITR